MASALRDLEHDKPEPPRIPRLIFADATPEALTYSLATQWPSIEVVSAEAGIVFGSHGMGKESVMRNLATLNQLWDGTSFNISRRSSESYTVRGARLTVALQVRNRRCANSSNSRGYWRAARAFWLASSWPGRNLRKAFGLLPGSANWPCLAAFNRRIAAILDQPVPIDEDGTLTPPMLSLTTEATAEWVGFYDAIESELSRGGELYDVRDVAASPPITPGAWRRCSIYSGRAAIGAETFESASRIAAWHLAEARRSSVNSPCLSKWRMRRAWIVG